MNSETRNSLTIDYAFIIAIFTGTSYLFSYLYYAGRYSYYKVPLSLIEINLSNIIYMLVYISPYIIAMSLTAIMISKLETNRPTNRKAMWIGIIGVIILFLVAVPLILHYSTVTKLWNIAGGVGIGLLYILCVPLYQKKYYKFLIITLYILTSVVIFIFGREFASEVKRYTIVENDKKTYVSLGVYDKHFILAPFNEETKEFTNEYKLVEIKDVVSFQQEEIGLIKMKK